ncbi:GNAT family N-acetyltransferase [Streptomyces scopuliridis]|uniref:N-acetyltransferase GCN5 n=1 Tax=Streptomyces scopuliridis RB72 TaxID=1440053 RepID=A0A2T7SMF1_9ACTN|nr:GNAT family N-acetyltransferase [Streptomyces scopuliridis]PVE04019.1 N-acetyltransferase GCN5 [Streptomyces scopuliridis RB72]
MDHDGVLREFDRQMREGARADGLPGVRVERAGAVVRAGGSEHDWHGVLWSAPDLNEDAADAAIATQIAHFRSLGREFEWKLYGHDRPVDLAARLLAAGFSAEPTEALMVAETEALTADVELPEGLRLLPVTDAAGVELMARAQERAFGADRTDLSARLKVQLAEAPDRVSAVVAMAGDTPVSAARMELPPGTEFAGLWGGGTVEEWRGKGLYRALVAYRARIAAARGYRYLQVDATDMSRPVLQRLGFTVLSTTTPFTYRPQAPGSSGSPGARG